jgi:hypothetical protein
MQGKARLHMEKQGKAWKRMPWEGLGLGMARQGKAWGDKAWHGKARRGKTWHG